MNTECVYVLKERTVQSAHEFADRIRKYGESREIYPISVAKIKQSTPMTPDYDGFGEEFMVKKGTLVVFVGGKLHNMMEIRPKGATRGFPCEGYWRECTNWFKDIEMFED